MTLACCLGVVLTAPVVHVSFAADGGAEGLVAAEKLHSGDIEEAMRMVVNTHGDLLAPEPDEFAGPGEIVEAMRMFENTTGDLFTPEPDEFAEQGGIATRIDVNTYGDLVTPEGSEGDYFGKWALEG
eukprot:CAMPEP_0113957608 /NCGR_PEP_ID=MMETSP0011_2-20120614/2876_1 /TAXON_ID=101924 /ORGANISM="Rhodosorus marinus" /LENGTH=126 /DNA_ID=CAMNT_0000968213 /DNA_START=9 /DNA_END=389 /DNA_ORIENTATION=- /assembly_acc=CAM_ASM_000156